MSPGVWDTGGRIETFFFDWTSYRSTYTRSPVRWTLRIIFSFRNMSHWRNILIYLVHEKYGFSLGFWAFHAHNIPVNRVGAGGLVKSLTSTGAARCAVRFLKFCRVASCAGAGSRLRHVLIYHSINIHVCIYQSINLSICLSVCLYIYMACRATSNSFLERPPENHWKTTGPKPPHNHIYIYICASVCVSTCLSTCMFVYLAICPSVHLSICLTYAFVSM